MQAERTERLALVVSQREKRAVYLLAEAEGGLTVSATVRRLIREAAKQHGLWPMPAEGQRATQEVAGCR